MAATAPPVVAPPPGTHPLEQDRPGWYCFSSQPRLAEWDGVAWSGATHTAVAGPVLPGPPAVFAFVRQRWFRWMVLGQALTVLPALLSGATGSAWWSWISVFGYVAFLAGSVMVVTRFLGLDRIEGLRVLTWIGITSGVVAFGVGFGLETVVDHVAGWSTTLWLTGPIEEGGKLLVPLLLLAYGAPRFKLPRVGLYLVLVSGATVGVLEGVEYEGRPGFAWAHLQMAMLRPSSELLHVFVTGFAAAVIWLAAWRRGRVLTAAGVVARSSSPPASTPSTTGSSPSSTSGPSRSTRPWPARSDRPSNRACPVPRWPSCWDCSSTSSPGTPTRSSPLPGPSPGAPRPGAHRSSGGGATRRPSPQLRRHGRPPRHRSTPPTRRCRHRGRRRGSLAGWLLPAGTRSAATPGSRAGGPESRGSGSSSGTATAG